MEIVQPAAAAPPPPPPVAVMPAATNNRRIQLTVCLWALLNSVVFAVVAVVADKTPCTKSTNWMFWCLKKLTDKAAAELISLLYGAMLCVTVAEVSAMLHMVLSEVRTKTTSSGWWRSCRGRWAAAAVDALAWVALAATVGVHCVEVALGIIGLAAHPEDDTYFYVDVVLAGLCLLLDLLALAGLLLCCSSPRRRKLLAELGGGQQV